MDCSPDMALNFLTKWKEEATLLTILMVGERFKLSGAGQIADCSNEGVLIVQPTFKVASGEIIDVPGQLVVVFDGASFEYAEPREAPSDIREGAERLFAFVLTIKSPDFKLSLSEMRDQPEIVEE